jgi:hypothetical protein
MAKGAESNLSGHWLGIYSYPRDLPPTKFEADLRDVSGVLTGEISEAELLPVGGDSLLHSLIEGLHDGSRVRFVKIYDNHHRMPDVVNYQGTIQPGGEEIGGDWEIANDWGGKFIMVRDGGAKEALKREAEVDAPI